MFELKDTKSQLSTVIDTRPISYSMPDGISGDGNEFRTKLLAQMDPQTFNRRYSDDEINHLEFLSWLKNNRPEIQEEQTG